MRPAQGRVGRAAACVCAGRTRGVCVRIYRAEPGASPQARDERGPTIYVHDSPPWGERGVKGTRDLCSGSPTLRRPKGTPSEGVTRCVDDGHIEDTHPPHICVGETRRQSGRYSCSCGAAAMAVCHLRYHRQETGSARTAADMLSSVITEDRRQRSWHHCRPVRNAVEWAALWDMVTDGRVVAAKRSFTLRPPPLRARPGRSYMRKTTYAGVCGSGDVLEHWKRAKCGRRCGRGVKAWRWQRSRRKQVIFPLCAEGNGHGSVDPVSKQAFCPCFQRTCEQ